MGNIDLRLHHGEKFVAKDVYGQEISGKVHVDSTSEEGEVFLCHNEIDCMHGFRPMEETGFKYSWLCRNNSMPNLDQWSIKEFRLIKIRKKRA